MLGATTVKRPKRILATPRSAMIHQFRTKVPPSITTSRELSSTDIISILIAIPLSFFRNSDVNARSAGQAVLVLSELFPYI
jgi:hypothetical protein